MDDSIPSSIRGDTIYAHDLTCFSVIDYGLVPEVLALAIANEEEDSRIYWTFAERCREDFPASARAFEAMADEEREHRSSLYKLYRSRFGEHLPPILREDVHGFMKRRRPWWKESLSPERMRQEASLMKMQAAHFSEKARDMTLDTRVRELFAHLAEVERDPERKASDLTQAHITADAGSEEPATKHRLFVLQYIQPGLAGLIDGSVSILVPIFAAAFATKHNWETFSRRPRRVCRRRDQHGDHGSHVRRWHHLRSRLTRGAGCGLWAHDDGRRRRAHAALSRSGRMPSTSPHQSRPQSSLSNSSRSPQSAHTTSTRRSCGPCTRRSSAVTLVLLAGILIGSS